MLRAAHLLRSPPGTVNLLLITKRWQQTTTSPSSNTTDSTKSTPTTNKAQFATNNPSSTVKTGTASTQPSFNTTTAGTKNAYKTTATPSSSKTVPPPTFSAPSEHQTSNGGGRGKTIKAIIYGITLGLTATIIYAEYENDSFRRKLESTIPYSSTILDGLDQVIDPVFSRQKSLKSEASEKIPDLAYVENKIPNKGQVKTSNESIRDTSRNVSEKLPNKTQIQKIGTQARDTIDNTANQVQLRNRET